MKKVFVLLAGSLFLASLFLAFHPANKDKFLFSESFLSQLGKLLTGSPVPGVYFDEGFEFFNSTSDLIQSFDQRPQSRADNTVVLGSKSHTGLRGVNFKAYPDSNAYLEKNKFSFKNGDHVWISGWYFLESVSGGDNSDIFILDFGQVAGSQRGPVLRLFLSQAEGYLQVEPNGMGLEEKHRQTGVKFPARQWVNVIAHYLLSDTNNGVIQVWQDGVKIIDTNGQTLSNAGAIYDTVQWGINDNGNSKRRSLFVDNLVVSSSPLETSFPSMSDPLTRGTPSSQIPRNAFTGDYFDSADMSNGSSFTNFKIVRTDPRIDFNWGYGSPHSSIGRDSFSVRWVGDFEFKDSGVYRFNSRVDDGLRIFVDGERIADHWTSGSVRGFSDEKFITAGWHRIQVNYFENRNPAEISVSWELIQPEAPPLPPVQAPILSLSVSTSSVVSGGSVTLSWDSENASSCVGSGNWSGQKPLDGVEARVITADSHFVLRCDGSDGTFVEKSVDVFVQPSVTVTTAPAISVRLASKAFSDTPTSLLRYPHVTENYNNRVLVVGVSAEDSAPADCDVSSVSYAGLSLVQIDEAIRSTTSNSCASLWYLINPPVGTESVEVAFAGEVSGSQSGAVAIYNAAQRAPESKTTATISGTSIQSSLNTVSSNSLIVDVLVAGATVNTPKSGQEKVYEEIVTLGPGFSGAFSAKKVGAPSLVSIGWDSADGGRKATVAASFAEANTNIDVVYPPPLLTRYSANPSMVASGSYSDITWQAENATSCVAGGGWSGTKSPSGTERILNITSNRTFTIYCVGPGGVSTQASLIVRTEAPTSANWGNFETASCISNKTASGCGWSDPQIDSGDNYVEIRNVSQTENPLNSGYAMFAHSGATSGNDKALWNKDLPSSVAAGNMVTAEFDVYLKEVSSGFITLFDIESGNSVLGNPGPRIAIDGGGNLELEVKKALNDQCSNDSGVTNPCHLKTGYFLRKGGKYRITVDVGLRTNGGGWATFTVKDPTTGSLLPDANGKVLNNFQIAGTTMGSGYTVDRIQGGNTVNATSNILEAYYDNFVFKINGVPIE